MDRRTDEVEEVEEFSDVVVQRSAGEEDPLVDVDALKRAKQQSSFATLEALTFVHDQHVVSRDLPEDGDVLLESFVGRQNDIYKEESVLALLTRKQRKLTRLEDLAALVEELELLDDTPRLRVALSAKNQIGRAHV